MSQVNMGIFQGETIHSTQSYPESNGIETSNALFQKPFSILYHLNDKIL